MGAIYDVIAILHSHIPPLVIKDTNAAGGNLRLFPLICDCTLLLEDRDFLDPRQDLAV